MPMDYTYNVEFILDYAVIITSVDVEEGRSEEWIAEVAGIFIQSHYGFNPFDICIDYTVNEA